MGIEPLLRQDVAELLPDAVFVVDDQMRLVGQVELEDLLLTARDRPLREITHASPLVVRDTDRASRP